ncbi:hypothetical protein BC629DRAFT_273759 [Irpex lacteus]|nr:hypothetical protein BC629DRAFT_273759 [Irpex lacteus]
MGAKTKKELEQQLAETEMRLRQFEEAARSADEEHERLLAEARQREEEIERQREEAAQREAELRQRFEEANAKALEAAQSANAARAAVGGDLNVPLINKPKGNISIPDVMETTVNVMYDEYQLMLRLLHSVAGFLDVDRYKKDQDKETENAVKAVMLKHFPVFKRFRNEWPLDDLIAQYLRSQREHQRTSDKAKAANAAGLKLRRERKERAKAHREQLEANMANQNIDPALR